MKNFQSKNRVTFIKQQLYFVVIVITISVAGCKKELVSPSSENQLISAEKSDNGHPHIVVKTGASIQAAIDTANSGTIIFIQSGTYSEAIHVDKAGIQLIGMEEDGKEIILQNPGDEENGIEVTATGIGFVLKNLTVQNFEENGVLLTGVDNFILDHVKAVNNKEYGLFPIFCHNGVISNCSATGSSDTGIYVGQSSDIDVEHNTAFANVSGFEIENCTNVNASFNESYDNAGGLLVFLLPGLKVKTATNISVIKNYIHDNNRVNFSNPEGGFEFFLPTGSGILVVGADNTTIEKNTISHNNFVGIATVSTLIIGSLAGLPPEAFADIEPNPDGAKIIENTLTQNGSAAPPGLPLPAADILWDGSGTNNCWSRNVFTTSYPSVLPVCNQ
ncbi:MAG: hypothetical protein JWR61_1862 [Ferruginibacter sp.]|uniref:parallel beta-helix domain-containing protein n=1 Tax=Ferruginibacter sp. TaxID=1940288 RepID=UPI002658EE39|nr:parallel beta-helix domain-containing protein [Ferruginibacter sp.]MDB5276907.1 hypothetical protein [Ferruginibacter sp.]